MQRARKRVLKICFENSVDEDEILILSVRRPRWIRERAEDFESLDERDFVTRYRLTKSTFMSILVTIEHQLEYETDRNYCISPINQLLCCLRFYATGCFQTTTGDLCGFSSSTVNRKVHKVSHITASLCSQYILFPKSQEEIRQSQLKFYRRAKFPRVIGAIDCTHIKLWQSPGGETAERFRNRKGYFSLNVQVICNADLEVMDLVARYDGSTHDSRIFRECKRRALFEQGVYGDAVLVGDSGYASANYMMTPLQECPTPGEKLYNESQIRTRNVVERFFGVWKRRFPVMALGLRVKLNRVFPIITATLVLHHIARRVAEEVPFGFEMTLPAHWEEILAQDNIPVDYVPVSTNRRITQNNIQRQALIDNHFERLVAHQQ